MMTKRGTRNSLTAFALFTLAGLYTYQVAAVPLGQPTPVKKPVSSEKSETKNTQDDSTAKSEPPAPVDTNPNDTKTATTETEKTTAKEPTIQSDTDNSTGKNKSSDKNLASKQEVAEEDHSSNSEANDAIPEHKKVLRAQFTSAVVDREPTDDVVMFSNNNNEIYFFTELANLNGESITHRWEFQGEKMAEIKFDVKGSRWRVFSSKKIKPEWTGLWSVIVIDKDGHPINISSLEIIANEANSN